MRALIIIGGAVAGYLLLSRFSASAAPAAPLPTPTPTGPVYTDFSPYLSRLPVIGQAAAVLKPIADNVTTPAIHAINEAVGGNSPYAAWTPNGDGTYTDGMGCKITINTDGTYNRHCPAINPKVTKALRWTASTANKGASAVAKVVTAPVHFVEGLF